MDERTDDFRLMKGRELFYRFLSRLYFSEVDEALLMVLKDMRFPDLTDGGELNEGYALMRESLAVADESTLTELAADYAAVFLGAGISSLEAAHPYESVYMDDKMMMQASRDEAVLQYALKGFKKAEDLNVPEDHIAFELEFLALLCEQASQTDEQNDMHIKDCIVAQLRFLDRMLAWVPLFCDDVLKYSGTHFYRGLAKITRAYLYLDCRLLENMSKGSVDVGLQHKHRKDE